MAKYQYKRDFKSQVEMRIYASRPVCIVSMGGLGKRPIFQEIENFVKSNKSDYSIKSIVATSEHELIQLVESLASEFRKTVLLVRISFLGDASNAFKKIQDLRDKFHKDFIPVIICSLGNLSSSIDAYIPVLKESVFIIQPNDWSDANKYFEEWQLEFGIGINEKYKEQIFNLSGGHTGLMKTLFVYFLDYPDADLSTGNLLELPQIQNWIERLNKELVLYKHKLKKTPFY